METKVAVVTGANKGIGFEIVKGLCLKFGGVVYLTARNEERGRLAVKRLQELGLQSPAFHKLDVTCEESVKEFATYISKHHSGIDVLVNNAGILDFDKSVSSHEEAKKLIDTNFTSLLTITKILYPLLKNDARIINLSSDWGLLSNIRKQIWLDTLIKDDLKVEEILQFVNDFLQAAKNGKSIVSFAGHYGDYKVSKVALSALTFVQQREFKEQGKNVSINCVHPGFVKTDMTKGMGDFTPERGAKAPLYLALEAPQTQKGTFVWHDCHQVNWDD